MVTPGGSKSPHVSFMNSPQLVATFATFCPETYDRAPIKVSPNPLAMPERGARFYSPTVNHFKLSAPPPPKAAALTRLNSILQAAQCASPAITEFEDPRSPKPVAHAAPAAQQIRFASFEFAATPARQPVPLAQSLGSYPRSPYPSAPLSPSAPKHVEADIQGRSRRLSDMTTSTRPRAAEKVKRTTGTPFPSSPLKSSFQSPTLQRAHRPAPLALEVQNDTELSNAFWNSMTLEIETPMVTALEYPESAVAMEEIDLKSPAPAVKSPGPSLMFGIQDGSVWSPSVAKKPTAARSALLRSALMSPGRAAFAKPKPIKHSLVASPSPSDPFASFPSFAAVLSLEPSIAGASLAFPARAMCA
jgi:hypothetical protein